MWCDICKQNIILETNNPPFYFQSRINPSHLKSSSSNNGNFNSYEKNQYASDDLELINYLDQEISLLIYNFAFKYSKIFYYYYK